MLQGSNRDLCSRQFIAVQGSATEYLGDLGQLGISHLQNKDSNSRTAGLLQKLKEMTFTKYFVNYQGLCRLVWLTVSTPGAMLV